MWGVPDDFASLAPVDLLMSSPDLAAWLASHDLGASTETFARNEITLPDLPLLSDADLRELGLPMGPRRRPLAAVAPGTDERHRGSESVRVLCPRTYWPPSSSAPTAIPPFVEELTRAVVEQEAGRAASCVVAEVAIPSSLHDSLMKRLDRLGQAKEIEQAGSVIGREFTEDQVAQLVALASATVGAGLVALQQAGLVFRQSDGAATRFSFKHALVQDAAYQSLLQARRKDLHLQAARMFLAQSALPEIVAHHFEQAGNAFDAVTHWGEAGRRAAAQGAHAEALNHLTHALALLDSLPAESAHDLLACDQLLQRAGSMRGGTSSRGSVPYLASEGTRYGTDPPLPPPP